MFDHFDQHEIRIADTPAYDLRPLLDVLGRGDVELRFRDGRSIKAHSQKLSLASNGILRDLLEDVLEGEIYAKRRRTDLEGASSSATTPGVIVRSPDIDGSLASFGALFKACMAALVEAPSHLTHACRLMENTRIGWRCLG